MASRRQRYAAFLAGPLADAVSASVLLGVLGCARRGWIDMSAGVTQMVGATLFIYFLRLVWQCFLFVRTDFYYVLATSFGCKNLLVDTEHFLHNGVARLFSSRSRFDQSHIPASEMRMVRLYSLLWLAGRAAAFASLFLVTLPVFWRYGELLAPIVTGGRSPYSVVDFIILVTLTLSVEGMGFIVWIRSLARARTERKANAFATS